MSMSPTQAVMGGYLTLRQSAMQQVIEVKQTLTLGDGSETQVCKQFGATLLGQGQGPHAAEMSPWGGATLLRWTGGPYELDSKGNVVLVDGQPKPSTVVKICGPIAACEVGKFTIDCQGVAGVGLELAHPFQSYIHDILIANPAVAGVRMHGVGQPRGGVTNNAIVTNCCANTIERVRVLVQGATTVGWEIGVDNDDMTFGVSQNRFLHCAAYGTGLDGQIGWLLRGCDSNFAEYLTSWNVGQPMRFQSPSQARYPGQFPYAMHMYMPFLWPCLHDWNSANWKPPITWSDNWNPGNSTVIDSPIREWAGGDLWYPNVVELPGNPRAIIWQGVHEKEKEG